MYSVFLVEDEIVIRDGVKNSFPWEQYGFAYVGDAADGEVALPLIKQTKPDVLITDIRMPFMDGIELSRMVKKELPDTRIIIISGYDDFSYAQEAIHIGVDNYVLKPITKDKLAEVMTDARQKLDEAQEKDNYIELFRQENQEYEQFSRVRFFNQLVSGTLSVSDVYEKAAELGLDLNAKNYNIILFDLSLKNAINQSIYSKSMAHLEEQLISYFMCCPEYIVFHLNMNTYAVVIKGDENTIRKHTDNCIDNIERRCLIHEDTVNWYLAEGNVVNRFSEFAESFQHANKKLSCRYVNPTGHVLTDDDIEAIRDAKASDMSASIDQQLIIKFLENALINEVEGFVDNIIPGKTADALKSVLFCRYFAMTIYMCVSDYLKKIGSDSLTELHDGIREKLEYVDGSNVLEVTRTMLEKAIECRDGSSNNQYKNQLSLAMKYVDEHFSDCNLNLNEVAKEVDISASYLSAMFSREIKTTFVEYVTSRRMEKACELLMHTQEKSAVIAEQIGYKDPHYFGFIFKKTYGMSPKEYRNKDND